jgi:hypothetical protein
MKAFVVFICFFPFLFSKVQAEPLLQPNDRIALCGDEMSGGFASFDVYFEDYLLMDQPVSGIDIEQFTWSAGTPEGLLARLTTDVLPYKPTAVLLDFNGGDVKTLAQSLSALVDALKKAGVHTIVIGSPQCVDSTHFQDDPVKAAAQNKMLAALAEIDKSVAAQEGVVYADVYGETTAAMSKAKAQNGDSYDFDGRNTICANLVTVYAFLKALNVSGDVGTVTVDYAANTATGTAGQKIVSFKDHTVMVESTRQPFHFPAYASGRPDPDPILAAFPFNDEMNRYTLIVQNLPTAQTKIYWGGDESRDYASTDLAKGINLTGSMLNRVFGARSESVGGGATDQQHQEQVNGEARVKGQANPQADAQHEAALQVAKARVGSVQFPIRIQPLAVPDPQPPGPIPVIVDTDMNGDIDDAAALALLNDFMDQGQVNLLACNHNTTTSDLSSCAVIQAINAYYGHPSLPIGQAYGDKGPAMPMTSILAPAPPGPGAYHEVRGPWGSAYALKIHRKFDPTFPNDDKMPAGVDIYRKALASAADGTVVICSIGTMENIQDLIQSQPDSVSNLSGLDLVRKKVRELVIMANTVPQDEYLLSKWPVRILWTTDIGNYIYPGKSLVNTPESNPVRVIFNGDQRQGWDPTAAWLAGRGTGDVYDVVEGRQQYIDDITHTPPGPHPNDRTATIKMPGDQVLKLFNDELARSPKY